MQTNLAGQNRARARQPVISAPTVTYPRHLTAQSTLVDDGANIINFSNSGASLRERFVASVTQFAHGPISAVWKTIVRCLQFCWCKRGYPLLQGSPVRRYHSENFKNLRADCTTLFHHKYGIVVEEQNKKYT